MNLNYIRYFLVAAETGSFTEASERLFITQPSLSVSIQKLEQSLGVKLFERQNKRQKNPVRLTSSGKHFLDKARDILNRFEAVKAELRHNSFSPQMLKIGILRTLPIVYVARLISDFTRASPSVVIEQVSGSIAELDDWLEKGDIDLAITILPGEKGRRRTSQLLFQQKILFQQQYLAAVAEDHPLAARPSLSLSELDGLLYIDRTKCEIRDYLQKEFLERGICPKVIHRAENDGLSNALVAAGAGLAVTPDQGRLPGIVPLPFSDLNLARPVSLGWRPGQNLKTVSLFRKISTGAELSKDDSCEEGNSFKQVLTQEHF